MCIRDRVLRHYSEEDKDSLKWEAARFLIENMPGHLSIGGESIGPYYAALNAVFSNDTLRNWQDSLDKIHEYYKSGLRVQEDIKVIKSGFLIANIDSAFRVWREKPWASHVGFDDFCEYILPYTVGQYQPLEDWRKKLATGYEEQIDLRHPRDVYKRQPQGHTENSRQEDIRIFGRIPVDDFSIGVLPDEENWKWQVALLIIVDK